MTNTAVEKLIDPKSLLVKWAKKIKMIYGHPVYLVDDAMKENKPRNIDILCVISDDEFSKIYNIRHHIKDHIAKKLIGDWDSSHWVWSADVIERIFEGWRETGENLNFKTISEYEYQIRYSNKEKILISGK